MVTDRDIVVRVIAHGLDPKTARVADAMTEGVVVCREDHDIHDAARLMENRKIWRLPVLDDREECSGVVSLGDLAVKGDQALMGEILRQVWR